VNERWLDLEVIAGSNAVERRSGSRGETEMFERKMLRQSVAFEASHRERLRATTAIVRFIERGSLSFISRLPSTSCLR